MTSYLGIQIAQNDAIFYESGDTCSKKIINFWVFIRQISGGVDHGVVFLFVYTSSGAVLGMDWDKTLPKNL